MYLVRNVPAGSARAAKTPLPLPALSRITTSLPSKQGWAPKLLSIAHQHTSVKARAAALSTAGCRRVEVDARRAAEEGACSTVVGWPSHAAPTT